MKMPDQHTAEQMRAAIAETSGREKGLAEAFDSDLNAMLSEGRLLDENLLPVAKDFLECLRKLDRAMDAGDAAGCVLLGARKEAKEALEDAGFSARQAKALIALGVSLCGSDEEPLVVLTPDQWRSELPDRDEEEDDEEDEDDGLPGDEDPAGADGSEEE